MAPSASHGPTTQDPPPVSCALVNAVSKTPHTPDPWKREDVDPVVFSAQTVNDAIITGVYLVPALLTTVFR